MYYSSKIKLVVFLAVLFFVVQSMSISQEKSFSKKGIVELSGSVTYANYSLTYQGEKGAATSLISFSPQAGYFFTDNFEVGLSSGVIMLPGLSFQSQSGTSITALQLFITPAYNFLLDGSNLTPFVEAQLGFTSLATTGVSRSGFSYGGRGGIKFVPVEHIVFTFAGQYLSINLKASGETERTGYNYFTIGVGVGVYF